MKKLLGILMLGFIVSTVSAQIAPLITPNYVGVDTVTAGTPKGAHVQIKGYQKVVTFNLNLPVITGTVAGKIYWQGSSDSISSHYATFDSTTLISGVAAYTHKEIEKGWVYYRALVSTTGTSTVSLSGTTYFTKP